MRTIPVLNNGHSNDLAAYLHNHFTGEISKYIRYLQILYLLIQIANLIQVAIYVTTNSHRRDEEIWFRKTRKRRNIFNPRRAYPIHSNEITENPSIQFRQL